MELVESLTSIVSSTSSMFVAGAGMVSSIFGAPRQAVQMAKGCMTGNIHQSSASSGVQRARLHDPALALAETVFTFVTQIQRMLVGDDGKPVWDDICPISGVGPYAILKCYRAEVILD